MRNLLPTLIILLLSLPTFGQSSEGTEKGTYKYVGRSKYEGEWKEGKLNGQGIYTWSDGEKYEGEWKEGKRHGQGTYTWSDGRKYEGEWKDSKRHGQGTYTWSDGEGKIEGEFKEGKVWNVKVYNKSGKVINTWKNGVKD